MTKESKYKNYVPSTYIIEEVRDIRGQFERELRGIAPLTYEDGTPFFEQYELFKSWNSEKILTRTEDGKRYLNEKIEAMWIGYYLSAKEGWAKVPDEEKLTLGIRDLDVKGERGGIEHYVTHTFFWRITDTKEDFLTKAIVPYNAVRQNLVESENE